MAKLNTMIKVGATDHDLVCLDLVFADETFEISRPLTRWQARQAILVSGPPWEIPYGPYKKRIVLATIMEYQVDETGSLDPYLPIH